MTVSREERHEDTKQKILFAARRLILEHGFRKVSLRAIAQAAQFSPAGLYEYFDSKSAILQSLAGRVSNQLQTRLNQAVLDNESGLGQLVAIGEAYIGFAIENPEDFLLLFGQTPSGRRSIDEDVNKNSPYELVTQSVIAAMQANALPCDAKVEDIAYAIWSYAHGTTMLQLTHLKGFEADFGVADHAALTALVQGFAH